MLDIKGGHLTIGGVDTVELSKGYGTPLYVTDEEKLLKNFRDYVSAFPDADIYYAAKANWNLTILNILAKEGAGADVFSSGELLMALKAGIPKEKILFNGNSKCDDELEVAINSSVKISVDSLDELKTISELAVKNDKVADIAFRVNPDVSPDTHPKISTGLRTSKFGIPHEEVVSAYEMAKDLPNVNPVGIHCHIGSQILDISVYREAAERMMNLVEKISSFVDLEFIDIGGGLGIEYHKGGEIPRPSELSEIVLSVVSNRSESLGIKLKLIIEPGRSIVGDTTILLSRVNTVKRANKNFVGIDAGFNLLIRPAMYDSYHEVVVANKAAGEPVETYSIVGPICETGDIIAKDRDLPEIVKGDLIAVLDSGAYGFSMSSQYNGRPRCAEVLISGGSPKLIRERETFEDLLGRQMIPEGI
ncbi:MAG: diaminopimelate decarboxylase [Halobacteriota archaeon]|nr:diaminopimelate decarboxylase [Halobacteriota archaeon]